MDIQQAFKKKQFSQDIWEPDLDAGFWEVKSTINWTVQETPKAVF